MGEGRLRSTVWNGSMRGVKKRADEVSGVSATFLVGGPILGAGARGPTGGKCESGPLRSKRAIEIWKNGRPERASPERLSRGDAEGSARGALDGCTPHTGPAFSTPAPGVTQGEQAPQGNLTLRPLLR
jgi:hypothetical protein